MNAVSKTVFVGMILVLVLAPAAMAEDPYQVAWTAQIGTSSHDYSYSVAVDASGNSYISGYTYGVLGSSSAGSDDAFLTKFDSLGNEVWTTQIGSSTLDRSYSVAVDGSGNSYISGYTRGVIGSSSAGFYDAFLTKFDSLGDKVWAQQIGTTSIDASYSVAVDAAGNAYISGQTLGVLGSPNAGSSDAFLTKFDSLGNKVWTSQIGTSSDDRSYSVAVDGSGNSYISGFTQGDLGGTNAGGMDAFLTKFDSLGDEVWSSQIGTSGEDWSWSVAVDGSGNAYISGSAYGDLGDSHAGGRDAFLTKFDTLGNEVWSSQIGTPGDDHSYSVAVDGSGNAYISGSTYGDLIEPGSSAGGDDAFLTKFDSLGNEVWTQQIGTSGNDYSRSVAVDAAGNAYISGYTSGDLGGTNAGGNDAFLVKFEPPAVTGRNIFYNNSAWDGNDAGANAADDAAIATNKSALLPGETASFANYTSFSKGINGIMIDATGTGGTTSASDFTFKVGNDSTPSGWATAPAPTSVSIRPGEGDSGSDRITITFADGAIVGKWLEVTYIPASDVFYFGNAPGETGDSLTHAQVTPTDEVYIRNNPATLAVSSASISHAGDFNRDKKVGPTDSIIARNNGTNSGMALQLITVP